MLLNLSWRILQAKTKIRADGNNDLLIKKICKFRKKSPFLIYF